MTALSIPFIPGDLVEGRNVTHSWSDGRIEKWEQLEVMCIDQNECRMYVKYKKGTQHFTYWCPFIAENFRLAKDKRPLLMNLTSPGIG